MSPLAMSREMLSALTPVYELATYSPQELRGVFTDWLAEIEREIEAHVAERGHADPGEIAGRFRLGPQSVAAILEKLARERRVPTDAPKDRPGPG
ncbi:MAG TPA: hypothetical protein VN317_07720 [Candidatus Methanoperedens sp.]|nr:hypothetical protein [Candidatus Methanoperedens sp.]